MITCIKEGSYELIETKGHTKILILDKKFMYAWVIVKGIGQLLVTTETPHRTDYILAMGKYRLYTVKNEPNITDLQHLELSIGKGKWQGYLLLTGLPTENKRKSRIIPTEEIITKSTNSSPYLFHSVST